MGDVEELKALVAQMAQENARLIGALAEGPQNLNPGPPGRFASYIS